MKSLLESLDEYSKKDYYPFHMPGHKRNIQGSPMESAYLLDITEIEGFDSLHHAETVLKEAQEHAAILYGAEETHFLINGSTAGVLSAVLGCTTKGGKILLARNCHKSVYNAVLLQELETVYVYPHIESEFLLNGGISPDEIETALKSNLDIQAVIITSPSYDGIVSDISFIAKKVHKYHIPLIVDEAHGAHFGFHKNFPKSALQQGADIVIHSMHKMLPALTQTALIHLNGKLISKEKIRKYLFMFQSSSPSYLLMASIDDCIQTLDRSAQELFASLNEQLQIFKNCARELRHIRVADSAIIGKNHIFDYDSSKIIISVRNTTMTGQQLYQSLLYTYHLQMEMAGEDYCLALVSVMDKPEGLKRLFSALKSIDERIEGAVAKQIDSCCKVKSVMTLAEAEAHDKIRIDFNKSAGKTAGEFMYLFPPGTPVLVPGEEITDKFIRQIVKYKEQGLSIQGLSDYAIDTILVLE